MSFSVKKYTAALPIREDIGFVAEVRNHCTGHNGKLQQKAQQSNI